MMGFLGCRLHCEGSTALVDPSNYCFQLPCPSRQARCEAPGPDACQRGQGRQRGAAPRRARGDSKGSICSKGRTARKASAALNPPGWCRRHHRLDPHAQWSSCAIATCCWLVDCRPTKTRVTERAQALAGVECESGITFTDGKQKVTPQPQAVVYHGAEAECRSVGAAPCMSPMP